MDDPTKQLGPAEEAPATAPAPEPPAAAEAHEGGLAEWQPRLYAKVILLAALVIYVVAFTVANSGKVKIDFLFHKAQLSVIWLILLCLAIGLVGGLLISQLARRSQLRRQRGEAGPGRKKRARD